MSDSKDNLFDKLNAPFPYEEYAVNYDGFVSISPQATSDRLNQVLGPHNWKHEVMEQTIDMERYFVSILGKLSIRDEKDEWIDKSQFGDATMVIQRGKTEPTAQAINDAKKKAVSDAMKKCASLLGVSSDVYRGRFSVAKSGTKDYLELVHRFGLDSTIRQFREGIVLLPDDYKSFYNKKGWLGIFVSDVKLQTSGNCGNSFDAEVEKLKKKFKDGGNGTLEGFDEWLKKLKAKGMKYEQLDYVLQEAINKKASEKGKSDSQDRDSGRKESTDGGQLPTKSDSKHKGEEQPSTNSTGFSSKATNHNPDSPINGVLKDFQVMGEDNPYFKLMFDLQGIPTEVLAVGALMDEVEKLHLILGSTCTILTREAKGKNLLRKINLAG